MHKIYRLERERRTRIDKIVYEKTRNYVKSVANLTKKYKTFYKNSIDFTKELEYTCIIKILGICAEGLTASVLSNIYFSK